MRVDLWKTFLGQPLHLHYPHWPVGIPQDVCLPAGYSSAYCMIFHMLWVICGMEKKHFFKAVFFVQIAWKNRRGFHINPGVPCCKMTEEAELLADVENKIEIHTDTHGGSGKDARGADSKNLDHWGLIYL